MLALISSRMAAWGQPPVSMARIRSFGSASLRIRNSWSSRVKMSLVTAAAGQHSSGLDMRRLKATSRDREQVDIDEARPHWCVMGWRDAPILYSSRSALQSANSNAVFPEPTGLRVSTIRLAAHRIGARLPADTDGEGPLVPVPARIVRHVSFRVLACESTSVLGLV